MAQTVLAFSTTSFIQLHDYLINKIEWGYDVCKYKGRETFEFFLLSVKWVSERNTRSQCTNEITILIDIKFDM